MSDAYRTSKTIVFSLDMRQVSGIIAGSLAVIVVTFALGVGFGHRLATGLMTQTRPVDLKKLDERKSAAVDETVYTYPKELASDDTIPPPPPPKPLVLPTVAPPPPPPAAKVEEEADEADDDDSDSEPDDEATAAPAPAAEAAAPKPESANATSEDTQPRFTVQFGAPARSADATRLVGQLKALGYEPFVSEADVPGKGHFFRVRIGRFPDREEAEKFRALAHKDHHLDGLVMGAQ